MLFDGFLLLSFTNSWVNVFGKIPEFEIFIDKKGKLNIISKETVEERK
ncbi:MAG: hypothetical protein HN756_01560 [Nitrosopumilus sp.]|jgi:hypothetical protein|nr:hypothetical protein [Nitrosopumilus sp.]